jgi:[ribosomal protein S5]-alanine N-acetyltransferase
LAGDPIPESVEMGFKWLQRHRERFHQQAGIRWAIVPKDSTASVGTIRLTITSKEERIADLGIVIARPYWGKGIGASAMHLVTGYAFNTLGLAEIQAEVLQRNLASRRLLEKSGFHLVRAIPGNPQLDPISEDCCNYQAVGWFDGWLVGWKPTIKLTNQQTFPESLSRTQRAH